MLHDQQGARPRGLTAGNEVEMVAALVRKHHPLEGQDQACPRGAARIGRSADVGVTLDREHPRVLVIDQVGAQRLPACVRRGPFDDQCYRHALLHCRKPGRGQLVEDAGEIESSVRTLPGLVAEHGELDVHRARKMPAPPGFVKSAVPGCARSDRPGGRGVGDHGLQSGRTRNGMKTILVALSHPDDEVGCAGTVASHAARGDRVVMLFLTHGEMTESLGERTPEEVGRLRAQHAREAAAILGAADVQLLEFQDTRVHYTPDASYEVARVVASIRPDAVITWGQAWHRGMRHPDHQATGDIVRAAVTIARMKRAVTPLEPHRGACPVFTLRERYSTLPETAIDITAMQERVFELASFYRERVGWPQHEWLAERHRAAGAPYGIAAAELFDAWESEPTLATTLV